MRKRVHARNIFLTVHNLGVGKKMKVGQEGPMSNFCTSAEDVEDMSTCKENMDNNNAHVIELEYKYYEIKSISLF